MRMVNRDERGEGVCGVGWGEEGGRGGWEDVDSRLLVVSSHLYHSSHLHPLQLESPHVFLMLICGCSGCEGAEVKWGFGPRDGG